MRKPIFFIAIILFANFLSAQSALGTDQKRYIEVSGTSETEVVPDELFITITLLERMDGKEKITIDKQEQALKQNLKELGIDLVNLTLSTADADFGKIRRSQKDVLVAKSYILKINNADMLSKVYERLDKIDVKDAYISRVAHSKILEIQKENRIKAIKAAKDKVEYLLAAVGQQAGSPLQLTETDNYVQDMPQPGYARYSNMIQNYSAKESEDSGVEISFKKIKVRASFLVRYEIINK